jgi:hypothetical protein
MNLNLVYDIPALAELERVTGRACFTLFQETPSLTTIRATLWAGMLKANPNAKLQDADRVIEEVGLITAGKMVAGPITEAIAKLTTGKTSGTTH